MTLWGEGGGGRGEGGGGRGEGGGGRGVKHNVKMTLFSAKIVWTSPLTRPHYI